MTTLLLATRNAHKVEEIRAILGARFGYWTLRDFPAAPAVIEDAATFAGNATKKAVELAAWLAGHPAACARLVPPGTTPGALCVVADDSGLEVDALGGAPGVHSARFAALDSGAAGNSPDAANNAKLLRLLRDVPAAARTARFRCVIALAPLLEPQPGSASPVCEAHAIELQTELFEGACAGRILETPRGAGGFGYDPLFVPEGFSETFAELGEVTKNAISHRARALAKLREQWRPKPAGS